MKRLRRIMAALLIAILMMNHISINAYAASKKDKKAVKAQVVKLMKNVKKYNHDGIANCFQPRKYRKGFTLFKQNSKYASTIRQVHKKYFDYEIAKIEVKGKKAKVKVYVTYYDLYGVYEDAFWDMVAYEVKHPGWLNSDFEGKAYQYMKKAIKKNGSYPLEEITAYIPLVKRNGKWKIEKMTKNMDYFIGCRYRQIIEDLYDKYG